MSFFKQAKSGSGDGGDFRQFPAHIDNPQNLIEYYEGNGQHMQAVRIRLWNGLPQREAHRDLVEKWLASGVARQNPPPPVPHWVKRGEPIEESEERRMERALWLMTKGRTPQSQVDAWPERWRQIGITRGYLNTDGTLRKFS